MRRLLLVLMGLVWVLAAGALTVERGRVRLVLHENNSRFSLYYNRAGEEWVPFFVDEDPRTSGVDILEGNQTYRMGDSGSFRQVVEETAAGARYIWTNPTLEIVQDFAFVRGVNAATFDAIQITLSITNVGEQTKSVAARFLFDTYLGESENVHFTTPVNDRVTRELLVDDDNLISHIVSPDTDTGVGFQLMLAGQGVTTVQSAVAANWKRLADSNWDFEVNPTRNFNRLPYSINDSALLVTYASAPLSKNQRYTVVLHAGNPSADGYLPPAASATTPDDARRALLAELTGILNRINEQIDSENPDPTAISELRADLEALTDKISGR